MNTIFRADLFQGQVALVTGGGSGIGLRTARELVTLGARVFLLGRNEEKLKRALETIQNESPGADVDALAADIRDEAAVENAVEEIVRKAGHLDLLVNNAGGQFPSPAAEIKRRGWDAVIETNLTGTFQVSRAAFQKSMRDHGGTIVNVIADIRNGFPMMAHTGAARAGVENLTKSLANEWGRHGVRVNAVAPGVILSSGLDTYAPEFRSFVDALARKNQASRGGTEAEVAAAIAFLLSPAAAFITGITLPVDGGASIASAVLPPVEHDRNPPFDDGDK